MIFFEIPFATPQFDETIKLRYDILREPLGLDFKEEDIAKEYNQIHLAGYDEQMNLVACLVLFPQEEEGVIKMRQVAVANEYQNKGLGTLLVNESEKLAKEKGYTEMMAHARETAIPFYVRLGYETYGKRFTEVKVPHFKIRKKL